MTMDAAEFYEPDNDFERFCQLCGEYLEFCFCGDDDEGWQNIESEVAAIDAQEEKRREKI